MFYNLKNVSLNIFVFYMYDSDDCSNSEWIKLKISIYRIKYQSFSIPRDTSIVVRILNCPLLASANIEIAEIDERSVLSSKTSND